MSTKYKQIHQFGEKRKYTFYSKAKMIVIM